ncbi:hypothetical protein AX16_005395 [Volvariella volvacea WC 439]|nr:hypothetical protein AX16_005395 [Volvariella volvacea WC 439]
MLATRRPSSLPALLRTYATKWPRPRPGTSERPPYRAKDPLVNNPSATVTTFEEEGLTFIHRPPPTAPTPHSLTTAPASPLLWSKPTPVDGPLPPPIRPSAEKPQPERASDEVIASIKELRRSNPSEYSRGKLAKMFGVTPSFVGAVAALKKSQRTALIKERDQKHAEVREKWSERKSIVRAIRAKRRALW